MTTQQNRELCLTMHQPWASLLVHGIKRIEGRSWASPVIGRLWIHAASKVPDVETIKAMEQFYKEIYAVDGVKDIKFPEHYPISVLIGCVNIVGCTKLEELVNWEELPKNVCLEGQTDYCWLCEDPQKLLVPFEMRGWQGVYNLDKKVLHVDMIGMMHIIVQIAAAAVRGLRPMQGPAPIKFPLPCPSNVSSSKPGAKVTSKISEKSSTPTMSPSLSSSIAGARAAASQFRSRSPAQLHRQSYGSSSYRR